MKAMKAMKIPLHWISPRAAFPIYGGVLKFPHRSGFAMERDFHCLHCLQFLVMACTRFG